MRRRRRRRSKTENAKHANKQRRTASVDLGRWVLTAWAAAGKKTTSATEKRNTADQILQRTHRQTDTASSRDQHHTANIYTCRPTPLAVTRQDVGVSSRPWRNAAHVTVELLMSITDLPTSELNFGLFPGAQCNIFVLSFTPFLPFPFLSSRLPYTSVMHSKTGG